MSRAWISTDPDGRLRHRFHQSAIGDSDICLERLRLGLTGDMPEVETDALSTGTAVHAGIEHAVAALCDYGDGVELEAMRDVAQTAFYSLSQLPHFSYVQHQEKWCRSFIDRALAIWYDERYPDIDPIAYEKYVGPYVIHEDEHRVIELAGSVDHVDRIDGLEDWKTASKAYEKWEKSRWNIQATTYTWLWDQFLRRGGLDASPPSAPSDSLTGLSTEEGYVSPETMPFTFTIMLKPSGYQRLTIERDAGDWLWLERKALALALQIERGTDDYWPMNDQSALCSPRFCGAWSACKGSLVSSSWPR